MFLAYYVHDLSPFLVQFNDKIGVRWYGLSYVAAFIAGYLLLRWLAQRQYTEIKPDQVGDFIAGCAIFGVLIGGRLGYMLFYDFGNFIQNPLIIIRVWDGGMSAHGGILGVTLYTVWYAWRHKLHWLNVADNIAVTVPIGLFMGRLANFVNGELYGRATTVSWAMQFPKELYAAPAAMFDRAQAAAIAINTQWIGVDAIVDNSRHSPELRAQLAEILTPRHPSQFYEAGLEGLLMFAILWVLRTRFRLPNGILSAAFFVTYAATRTLAEFFREPDAPLTGPLTRGQFLSVFLVLVGVIVAIYALRRPQYAPKWQPR